MLFSAPALPESHRTWSRTTSSEACAPRLHDDIAETVAMFMTWIQVTQ